MNASPIATENPLARVSPNKNTGHKFPQPSSLRRVRADEERHDEEDDGESMAKALEHPSRICD